MKYKNKLLFVGGMFPEHQMQKIIDESKGHIQYAANKLQWNLINGFDSIFDGEIELLSTPFIGGYPSNYKKLFIQSEYFSHNSTSKDYQAGFFNLRGFKDISLYYANKKSIKKWIEKNYDYNLTIVFYSLQIYYLKLAKWIKENYKNVHLHVIIPDLPIFMNMQYSNISIHMLIKKYHNYCCNKNILFYDSYTLLTKEMIKSLNLPSERCVVVEGVFRESTCDSINSNKSDNKNKTIVYTGTLTKKYGVMDLVKAFELIDDENYELLICGEGEAKLDIEKAAEYDSRILYKGQLSNGEILKIQRNATLLVNPRKNDIFTKYSFPSKLMEYLGSGVPVLCYKLDGIPKEYDDYLNYIPNDNLTSFMKKMVCICNLDPDKLNKIGENGKKFVLENKTPEKQVEKIVNCICKNTINKK